MTLWRGKLWSLLSFVFWGVLEHILAPRWNFGLYVHNPFRGRLGWDLFKVTGNTSGTTSGNTSVESSVSPPQHLLFGKLKGTLLSLHCSMEILLVAEIRTLVCKQSQVRKCSSFQQAEISFQ